LQFTERESEANDKSGYLSYEEFVIIYCQIVKYLV